MIERYENMRRSVLEGGGVPGGAGLGLFLEQGMAAWLRLWSALPEPLVRGGASAVPAAREEPPPGGVVGSSKKELAMVVAEIVMKQLRSAQCRI